MAAKGPRPAEIHHGASQRLPLLAALVCHARVTVEGREADLPEAAADVLDGLGDAELPGRVAHTDKEELIVFPFDVDRSSRRWSVYPAELLIASGLE